MGIILYIGFRDDVALAIIGVIQGTIIVALIVDWINRRDDSRHAKRPPDPP
jgi:hypothetical protein